MKSILYLSCVILLISCTGQKKVFEYGGAEYWSEFHAGDTTTLQYEYEAYSQGTDTIVYYTNYYTTGALKSKVVMKNDLLMEIELLKDTLGNKLDFGNFKNGNGYAVEYSDDGNGKDQEGEYVDGNREGWWMIYHYSGEIGDSLFYEQGYLQLGTPRNSLDSLLQLFGPVKHNLYR